MSFETNPLPHSQAWVAQTWISFGLSAAATAVGIAYLPVGSWPRAFLAISTLMTVSSSISLTKTLRDLHESSRLVRKVDEARVTKLLTETPPSPF